MNFASRDFCIVFIVLQSFRKQEEIQHRKRGIMDKDRVIFLRGNCCEKNSGCRKQRNEARQKKRVLLVFFLRGIGGNKA